MLRPRRAHRAVVRDADQRVRVDADGRRRQRVRDATAHDAPHARGHRAAKSAPR